jgi:hypothetical protein
LVKIRYDDFETLLPEQEHEPEVDEKAMEEQVVEWLQNDEKEKDSAEFMSEREFCSFERDQLKTAKYFQHKFSNKDDPINWTILVEDEDITDCSAFKTIVQNYEEEGASLDPDLLEAMDTKKAHEVFFEFVFPTGGVAARMDKYYEIPELNTTPLLETGISSSMTLQLKILTGKSRTTSYSSWLLQMSLPLVLMGFGRVASLTCSGKKS